MKSELAIKREYERAKRAIRSKLRPNSTWLQGTQQALAWVLEDNAMAPVRCAVPSLFRRKRSRKKAKSA